MRCECHTGFLKVSKLLKTLNMSLNLALGHPVIVQVSIKSTFEDTPCKWIRSE